MFALQLPDADPAGLPTAELEQGFAELQRCLEAIQATRLVWLAELDRRKAWRRDGYVSAGAWLAGEFGLAGGAAKRDVTTAVALRQMPASKEALLRGDVSPLAVGLLVEARQEHPEAFARH